MCVLFCCRVRIVMLMCWLWRFRAAPVSVHIFYGVTAATKLWHSCDKIRRQHLCTAATKSRDKILASPRQNICIAATKYLHRRDKIFASMLQNYCFAATKYLHRRDEIFTSPRQHICIDAAKLLLRRDKIFATLPDERVGQQRPRIADSVAMY